MHDQFPPHPKEPSPSELPGIQYSNNQSPRILIIRGGGLGDFLLVLPVLGALRRRWPASRLEILGNPTLAELGLGSYADAVQSIHQAEFARFFRDPLEYPLGESRLDQHIASFDLVISFLLDKQLHLQKNVSALGPRFLAIYPPQADDVHCTEHFLRGLEPLGIETRDHLPRIILPADEQDHADRILEGARPHSRKPLVAIHCGSGSPHKNWPARDFAEVACWLRDTGRFDLALVQGIPDQRATTMVTAALSPHAPLSLRNLPLVRLAGVLRRCRLLLGNDSGISHLAAAVGTPVVALFGPTSPQVWRPLGSGVRVLRFSEATVVRVKEVVREILMPNSKIGDTRHQQISSPNQIPE